MLLSLSGEMRSRSTSPAVIRAKTSAQSSWFVEFTVSARIPRRSAISI
jgi:hypothetical protein